jgi:uncharacterized protein DUF3237
MGHAHLRALARIGTAALTLLASTNIWAATQMPAGTEVSAPPTPKLEFVFEEFVTLGKAVTVGDTPFGNRTYIPITGGTVTGPKFNGKILPGGWDWQLHLPNGCASLAANYMIQANDGTIVNVSNKGVLCGPPRASSYWTPTFEAPNGPYDWMTGGTFIDVLTVAGTPEQPAVRIRFYQVK